MIVIFLKKIRTRLLVVGGCWAGPEPHADGVDSVKDVQASSNIYGLGIGSKERNFSTKT